MKSLLLRAWKLGLTTSYGVPSPKYDMDAYMATLFLEVKLRSCGESWVWLFVWSNSQHNSELYLSVESSIKQKARPNSHHSLENNLCIK